MEGVIFLEGRLRLLSRGEMQRNTRFTELKLKLGP